MNFLTRSALLSILLILASCSSGSSDEPGVTDPNTPEPELDDPTTPDPEVADPTASDPEINDPTTPDPEVSDPNTPDPEVSDPNTPDPEVSDPSTPDPEVSDPNTPDPEVTDPVADPTSEIDGDNYIDLLSITARAVLRDYQRVMGEAESAVDSFLAGYDGPQDAYTTIRDCPLGGTATDVGVNFDVSLEGVRTYSECVSNAGTLNGTVGFDFLTGNFDFEDYDLTVTNYSGSQSFLPDANTIELEAVFDAPAEFFTQIDITHYTETSNSQTLKLEGSGGFVFDDVGTSNGLFLNVDLLLDTTDGSEAALSANLVASAVEIDTSGALETGSLSATASDGSKATLAPGDTAGTVNITRVDSSGIEFTETRPWSDVYP